MSEVVNGCHCDETPSEVHTCPFREMFDDDSLCYCCEDCTSACADDV